MSKKTANMISIIKNIRESLNNGCTMDGALANALASAINRGWQRRGGTTLSVEINSNSKIIRIFSTHNMIVDIKFDFSQPSRWALDSGSSGNDERNLVGTYEEVLADILNYHGFQELPQGWSLVPMERGKF